MEAEKILKMIESYRAGDREREAQINESVCHYFGLIPKPVAPYMTSRDALRFIRPDGFWFTFNSYSHDDNDFTFYDEKSDWHTNVVTLATETAAELHAIIQATEYRRETANR